MDIYQPTSFQDFRHLLPNAHEAYWTDHFRERAVLRGFTGNLLNRIWDMGEWVPAERNRWAIRYRVPSDGIWEVIVDFDIDPLRPWLISVAWEPAQFAA